MILIRLSVLKDEQAAFFVSSPKPNILILIYT